MGACGVGEELLATRAGGAALRRARDQAAANQIRLVDFFDRAFFLARCDGDRLESDGPPLANQDIKDAPVERAEAVAVDAETRESLERDILVDAIVVVFLREIADATQEAVGDTRRAAAALGDHGRGIRRQFHAERTRRTIQDRGEITVVVQLELLLEAEARAERSTQQALPRRRTDEGEARNGEAHGACGRPLIEHDIHHEVFHRGVQHLFHGAHDEGKLRGVVEVRIHPEVREAEPGEKIKLKAVVVNAKAGHKVPSGSAEERVLWLHIEAKDTKGRVHHLAVDRKGFDGEDYTIASSNARAYQDIGDIKGLAEFEGLPRDGNVPDGDRIFRLPYLDPQGRMTIAQWNTASFGPDYRLAPLEARNETYTWTLPDDLDEGEVVFTAKVYYSRLVSSVAEYLEVPEEEWTPVEVGSHETRLEVFF